jgi:hypothetical protein
MKQTLENTLRDLKVGKAISQAPLHLFPLTPRP